MVANIASPIAQLYAEERHRDLQAREAVFTTYNADLGFFERTVLGVAQASGARITVVADGRVNEHDPRAVRNAGVRYVPGIAVTASGAAFHPKVNVVVGNQRAVVLIGSGNLTASGWHHNAETWTVVTADRERCPRIVRDVGDWLRRLPDTGVSGVVVTQEAALRMRAAAEGLDSLAAQAPAADGEDERHRLVHSLDRPILEQLPEPGAAVQVLELYAPFHDPQGSAIRALVERYRPAQVRLAVQSDGRTVWVPGAVSDVVEDLRARFAFGFTLVEDRDERYRHGKLVQATLGNGYRWTLTGSPNLSVVALLRTARQGGNVEVGVITTDPPSLFPAGVEIDLRDATHGEIAPGPGDTTDGGAVTTVLLLAAVLRDGLLRVTLARPARSEVTIVASHSTDYDVWSPVGRVPAGVTTAEFPVPPGMGSADRVRAQWEGPDGIVDGLVTFVIDPARVSVTAADVLSGRRRADHTPTQLAVDARFLDMWVDHITQVSTAVSTVTLPRVSGTSAAAEDEPDHGARLADEDAWLRYTDDAKRHLGRRVVDFALGGFPRLTNPERTGAVLELATPTDALVDERAAALEGDDADQVNEETDPFAADGEAPGEGTTPSGAPSGDVATGAEEAAIRRVREARHRRRIRERLRGLVGQAPLLHPLARQSVALLVIVAQQSDVFDSPNGEEGYSGTLSEALRNLEHLDAYGGSDIPERLLDPLASTAAVGVFLLHEVLPTGIRTSEVISYRAVLDAVGHLLPYASQEQVAGFVGPMRNRHGFPIDPEEVMRIAALAVQDDPLLTAREQLERNRPRWDVHAHGARLLHVHSARGVPFSLASEALELLGTVDNAPAEAACWASNDRGDWCLLAREREDVWRAEPQPSGRVRWMHYVLRPLMGPVALRDADAAMRTRQQHGPLLTPIPEAIAAFVRCGADISAGPPADCRD
ncbi:hypothetical protein [Geodermatophilus sp. URMC 65]